MKESNVISNNELIAFSSEHLYYEIWMFYEVAFKLARREADPITGNALIESFGIHAAIILDFMLNNKDKADDAIANDYVMDKTVWRNIASGYRKKLNFIYKRRDKELAHLSYERLKVGTDRKQWNFIAIGREIFDLVDCFIDSSYKTLIHPNMLKLKGYFRNHSVCQSIADLQSLPLIGP